MSSVEVDATGINALAARCQSLAAEVGRVSPSPASMPSRQATAAAVAAVHADVAAAGSVMVARLETTSAKLAAVATLFVAQEIISAYAVAAVAPTSTV
jgi:hypothetical protein